mgnify:CR=1 FL=1
MAFTRNLIITIFVAISTLAHFAYVQETIGNNETTTAAPLIPSSFGSISLNELNETFQNQLRFEPSTQVQVANFQQQQTPTTFNTDVLKHVLDSGLQGKAFLSLNSMDLKCHFSHL